MNQQQEAAACKGASVAAAMVAGGILGAAVPIAGKHFILISLH